MNPTNKLKDEPLHKYPDAKVTSKIFSHYGIDTSQFNALSWISDDIALMSSGKFVLFVNLKSGAVESQDGPADGGVGFVTVHPSKEFYVVGERAPKNPAACVYSWPAKELQHRFEGGAAIGYRACSFNAEGNLMATVAGAPDFTLVVWDFINRSMVLRCKCFGSDVNTVRFSAYDSSLLVTGGSGHIKFWTMAKTFTGLKLQGTLGKFGRLEISDITGFVVLPDGKVLSGSENGNILLWEGDLVKCSFVKEILKGDQEDMGAFQQQAYNSIPCHEGVINCIDLIHDGKVVVTAGDDGYLRYWNREELEVAEGDGLPPMYTPKCLLEVCVSKSLHIRSMTFLASRSEWSVLDTQGVIATSPFPTLEEIFAGTEPARVVLPPIHFNGGGVTCSAISATDHCIITGGEDGVIRLIDYVKGKEKFHHRWAALATEPNPVAFVQFFKYDNHHETFLAGYSDGTIKLMRRRTSDFTVLGMWKPHTDGLFALAISQDEKRLATVSKNGTVFFFEVEEGLSDLYPVGFCHSPMKNPTCVEWDEADPCGCFLGYEGGQVISVAAPKREDVNHDVTFEFPVTYSLIGLRQRKLPPPREDDDVPMEEEEDLLVEKDNGPWTITFMRRLKNGQVAVGFLKEELVYAYDMAIRYPTRLTLPPLPPTGVEPPNYVEEPGDNLCYTNFLPLGAFLCPERNEFLVVCDGAKIILRNLDENSVTLVGQSHDSTCCTITGAFTSYDGSMIITTGMDGLVVTLIRDECKPPSPHKALSEPPLVSLFAEEEEAPHPVMSIQEQKEADDKAREDAEMQRKMNNFLGKVHALHDRLKEIMETNETLPSSMRIAAEDLEIDPSLHERLAEEKQRRLDEARKPFLLATAREDIRTMKLRRRFVDNLVYDRFVVRSFDNEFFVASFRTLNPMEGIRRLKEEIKGLEDSASESDLEDENPVKNVTVKEADKVVQQVDIKKKDDFIGAVHMSASVRQQLDKLDERRRERQERRKGYEDLLARKPDPAEDSRELALLREHDIAVRGECVLRTDPKYKGKPGYAPTATAKLERTILVAEYLVERRTTFNEELLKMRNLKQEKINIINNLRSRISKINQELNDTSVEASPLSLQPEEQPEKRLTTDREGLEIFAKEREEERLKEEAAKKAQRGFGADLAGAGPTEVVRGSQTVGQSFSREQGRQSIFMNVANRERLDAELRTKLENIKPSEIEEEERDIKCALLLSERQRLLDESRSIAAQFDRDLKGLVFERANVDADICLMDARLLLLFREYQLLLVFRKRDKELLRNLKTTKHTREKIRKEIDVHVADMAKVGAVMTGINERLDQANQAAEAYLQEHSPPDKLSYIMKVYYRQIKRKKNTLDDDDNDDITSDDDDDYEIDDGIGEEICPNNCDFGVWEEMLRLREIRLDITDELNEEKDKQDGSSKSKEDCEAKVEELGNQLKQFQKEKELLEAEKRKELNMLNAVVSLRCHQVKCLDEDGMCPADLHNNPVLVISDEELRRLDRRISELALEKRSRREEIASMSAEHQRLQDEKGNTQHVHDDWDDRVNDVMMLKFGQRVDLELLESCGTSRRIEAKKEELRNVELKWEREIRRHESRISALRDRLQATLIHNTHLLQDYSAYESERQALDRDLSAATKKTIQRYRGARVATAKDRMNLRNLISAQQREMDALNAEIIMLRRKGGHAYTPAY
eukprot:gene9060-6358_t